MKGKKTRGANEMSAVAPIAEARTCHTDRSGGGGVLEARGPRSPAVVSAWSSAACSAVATRATSANRMCCANRVSISICWLGAGTLFTTVYSQTVPWDILIEVCLQAFSRSKEHTTP